MLLPWHPVPILLGLKIQSVTTVELLTRRDTGTHVEFKNHVCQVGMIPTAKRPLGQVAVVVVSVLKVPVTNGPVT